MEDTSTAATYSVDDDMEKTAVESPTETDVVGAATAVDVVVVVKHLAAVGIIAVDVVAVAGIIVVVHVIAVGTSAPAVVEIVVVVEAHSTAVNDTAVVAVAVVG